MRKIAVLLLLIASTFTGCYEPQSNDIDAINDHFYVKSDGANLPVQIQGNLNSNVLVFVLHGGPGGDATIYNEATKTFSDKMEQNYAMVYYDQRGSGISSGNYKKRESLTIDQHVIDLDKVITATKFKYGQNHKVFLLGHSWGGTLGTAYLLTPGFQQKIDGWIEVDGAHNFSGTTEISDMFRQYAPMMINANNSVDYWQGVLDFVNDLDTINDYDISQLNSYGHSAEQYLANDGFITGEDLSAEYFKMYYSSKYNSVTASVNLFFTSSGFGMFDEVSNTDFTDQLGEITIPCLFLWGKYDFVIPPALGIEAFEKVSTPPGNKQMVIFETSAHSPMINQPQAFTEQVVLWIDKMK
ncbi:MAG: alpha/beta fold hydrolase [Bacteroidia bacterium]